MLFRDQYFFLSNFYPCKVSIYDDTYQCVEAAYQAAKCKRPQDRALFRNLNGAAAKKMGRRVQLRDNWSTIKTSIMYYLLMQKFAPGPLRDKLLEVKGEIVEDNYWGDTFWGRCNGKGHNYLGRMLEEIRGKDPATTNV